MRKLKICEHISLDGVIQHSADENNFPLGDWTTPFRSLAGRDALLAAHGAHFDLLLGRRTYDLWSGFWPQAPASAWSDSLNGARKYVVTHRPESLAWGPSEAVSPHPDSDLATSLAAIKAQPGPDLILWGSSTLTSTLLEHGLADELLLVVYPVLLGVGKRLFADATPARSFRLVHSAATPTGAILSTYTAAGPLQPV